MAIQVGDAIPDCVLSVMSGNTPVPISSKDWFSDGTVVLFSVPGAFTPTCSAKHLPGFIEHYNEIVARGVDKIGCTAVNDVFVMDAWGKQANAGLIEMLADGNAEFVRALDLETDASPFGMGIRGKRFALVARQGVVTHLFVDEPGEFKVSSAEHVLSAI